MSKEKVVLILSGGLDSTTLLYKLVAEGKEVLALSFDYNQRHKRELVMAKKTCEKLKVSHSIYTFPTPRNSALTDDIDVPEGHYAQENMRLTIVPNRNMIMLAIAAGIAEGEGIKEIYYAAHSGDHAIYWDCREDFVNELNKVLQLNDNKPVKIICPFAGIDKGDIACLGKALEVDFSLTHTCYKGEEIPCTKCGACTEREESFQKAKMKDPLVR